MDRLKKRMMHMDALPQCASTEQPFGQTCVRKKTFQDDGVDEEDEKEEVNPREMDF